MLPKFWKRGKGGGKEKIKIPSKRSKRREASGVENIIGIISGKGGCGKSLIAVSIATITSTIYRLNKEYNASSSILIDVDIVNATSSNILASYQPTILSEEEEDCLLGYIVTNKRSIKVYQAHPPIGRTEKWSIGIGQRGDLGVAVGKIYLMPAKKATPRHTQYMLKLRRLTTTDIQDSVMNIYDAITRNIANKVGAGTIIFDLPPLKPERSRLSSKSIMDKFLTLIPSFIAVVPADMSAVHGFVALLSSEYSFLRRQLKGIIVNMIPTKVMTERFNTIKKYIENYIPNTPVLPVRYSRAWYLSPVYKLPPPVLETTACSGATFDLLLALSKLEIIAENDIETIFECTT